MYSSFQVVHLSCLWPKFSIKCEILHGSWCEVSKVPYFLASIIDKRFEYKIIQLLSLV